MAQKKDKKFDLNTLPKIQADWKVFDRWGKSTEYTSELVLAIISYGKELFQERKEIPFEGDDGNLFSAGQFQLFTLHDPDLTYQDLFNANDIKQNPFLHGTVKLLTRNKVNTRAGHVLYVAIDRILEHLRKKQNQSNDGTEHKVRFQQLLGRIAHRIYNPDTHQRAIDEKEGPRLISLYKVLAASNTGNKELTQKLFVNHAKNYPSDDRNLLTDFIALIDQYKQNNISAKALIEANENATLTDLMLYIYYAYVTEDLELIEAFLSNPNESKYIHFLLIILYQFINKDNKDYVISYKFLLVSINLAIKTNKGQKTSYAPEVTQKLDELVNLISSKRKTT